jgi:hypothetical protein
MLVRSGVSPLEHVRANATIDRDAVYVSAFALLALYFLIWPIWRAQFPLEIWPTEGFNAYLQDAAAAGLKLYPAPDSLVGNNYPPLSFFAIGWLGRIFGDPLYVGRVLSIVGLLCVAAEIFLCVRLLTGRSTGAVIGALWYVAIMCHNSTVYVGANDPQLAGEAIMGAALVMLIARYRAGTSPLPALLLMVVGGFWKHNMIGIPLTAVSCMILRDWRRAIGPLLIAMLAIVSGFVICCALFGSEVIADMMPPREYRLSALLGQAGHLQWMAPALALWAWWAVDQRRSQQARFTAVHVVVSLGACLLQWTGDGVYGNAEFDLILALGIGVGVAYEGLGKTRLAQFVQTARLRDGMVLILLLRLIVSDRQETAFVLLDPDFRAEYIARQQAFARDVAAVAAIPGDVFCTVKQVCRAAGKAFVVDEFKFENLIKTGRATRAEMDEALRRQAITPYMNDYLTTVGPDRSLRSWFRGRP